MKIELFEGNPPIVPREKVSKVDVGIAWVVLLTIAYSHLSFLVLKRDRAYPTITILIAYSIFCS